MKKKNKIILSSIFSTLASAAVVSSVIVYTQPQYINNTKEEKATIEFLLNKLDDTFSPLASIFGDAYVLPKEHNQGTVEPKGINPQHNNVVNASTPQKDILPKERNGVKLEDIDTKVFDKFFKEIEQYIQLHLDDQNTPIWTNYADFLQQTLQVFADEVQSKWDEIISESKLIMYILGKTGYIMLHEWMVEMLAGNFSLGLFLQNTIHLNEFIVDSILTPITGSREESWKLIIGFYWNTWYLGLDHNHLDGLNNPNHGIDFRNIVPGEETPYETPTYSHYNWNDIRIGDILYSANGFVVGDFHSGHVGIISGWRDSIDNSGKVVRYLQVIEPNQYGVCYCAVDDARVDSDNLSILRITHASDEQAQQAVDFAQKQIGKDYYLPVFPYMATDVNTSSWNCSELIWACYKNVGFDIQNYNYEGVPFGLPCEPGAMPHNILHYEGAEIILQNDAHII